MSSSETTLVKLDTQPGIFRDITDYSAVNAYTSCQLFRFRDGQPEKFGGWVNERPEQQFGGQEAVVGVPRDIHSWNTLAGGQLLCVATNSHLQLVYQSTIYDITPIEVSTSATDPFSVTSGSTIILVSSLNHNRQIGDYVEVFQGTSIGNVFLDGGSYEVVSVINTNSFLMDSLVTADLTSVNAGGSTQLNFLLPSGSDGNTTAFGWGAGTWGTPGVSALARMEPTKTR